MSFHLETAIVLLVIAGGMFLTAIVTATTSAIRDWYEHHAARVAIQREVLEAAAAFVPPRARHNIHCGRCGRFARKIASGKNWYEYECGVHGHGWHAEKLIGTHERPIVVPVTVSVVRTRTAIKTAPTLAVSEPMRIPDWLDAPVRLAISP